MTFEELWVADTPVRTFSSLEQSRIVDSEVMSPAAAFEPVFSFINDLLDPNIGAVEAAQVQFQHAEFGTIVRHQVDELPRVL
jgi:hypothetical protein